MEQVKNINSTERANTYSNRIGGTGTDFTIKFDTLTDLVNGLIIVVKGDAAYRQLRSNCETLDDVDKEAEKLIERLKDVGQTNGP